MGLYLNPKPSSGCRCFRVHRSSPSLLSPSHVCVPARSSNPDVSYKPRGSEAAELPPQQLNGAPFLPLSRTPFPAVTIDQSISTYSGTASSGWTQEASTDPSLHVSVFQETQ